MHLFKRTICNTKYTKTFILRKCSSNAKRTVLYDYHILNKGKMVNFAGYEMPVNYGNIGISKSHNHVRSSTGLFDVSHMLQMKIFGKDKTSFIESLIVGDIAALKDNSGMLSLFTNKNGGIMDDLICSKINSDKEYLYVVSNAGCKDKILAHLKSNLKDFSIELNEIDGHGLIAVQGPKATEALQKLTPINLNQLYFMNTTEGLLDGTACRITRCGYTGEDGFELSIPNEKIQAICEALTDRSDGAVQLAGLGARDSLRLEAGLCLYGNDIDETTTPIEAGLTWTISKKRRHDANFPGAEIILKQLAEKPKRKRIGIISEGVPIRSGYSIINEKGEQIGQVTSGCPSPTVGKNIGMAYVQTPYSKIGMELLVKVRNKSINAIVTKMPFVKCNYYTQK